MFLFGIALLLSLVSSSCNNLIISKEKYTWEDAMEYCTNISALPVSSDIILNSSLTLSAVVWTSNTVSMQGNCTKSRICGLMLINHTVGYTGNIFLGDCNATRSFPCKENSESSFTYRNYTYDDALLKCVYHLTKREIKGLETGFYWLKLEKKYCDQQTKERSGRLCGVYGAEFGPAFGYCSVTNFASCTFGLDSADRELGVKIGVPVGVCFILVCGVVITIVYVRRCRKQDDQDETNYKDTTKKGNRKLKTCSNKTYELQISAIVIEDKPDQIVRNTVRVGNNNQKRGLSPETNSGNESVEKNESSFINREYGCIDTHNDVRNKELNSSGEDFDNSGYCFAKNEPEHHIYNYADEDNGQYDAVTTKRQEDIKPEHVYNHVSYRSDMESDYDSTIPGKQLRHQETDNVYNTFSGDGVDESNEYGFTESRVDTGESEIEDKTYNTLKLK